MYWQARRQEFPEGGSSTCTHLESRSSRQGIWGPWATPRSPGVFGAKSFNLAISRYFIQTFGKSCFSKLKFYTNLDFDQSQNVAFKRGNYFSRGGGVRSNLDPPPPLATGMIDIMLWWLLRFLYPPQTKRVNRNKSSLSAWHKSSFNDSPLQRFSPDKNFYSFC